MELIQAQTLAYTLPSNMYPAIKKKIHDTGYIKYDWYYLQFRNPISNKTEEFGESHAAYSSIQHLRYKGYL